MLWLSIKFTSELSLIQINTSETSGYIILYSNKGSRFTKRDKQNNYEVRKFRKKVPHASLIFLFLILLEFQSNTLGKLLDILSLILLACTVIVIGVILFQADVLEEFFDAVTWTPMRLVLTQVNKISLFAICPPILLLFIFHCNSRGNFKAQISLWLILNYVSLLRKR